MLETILGIILTIIPFILIFAFRNRLLGFIYIFCSLATFHLLLAIITQAFHIFNYPIILSVNCILAILSILYFIKKKIKINNLHTKASTLLIFLVIIFNLTSVHFIYTGKVNTINGIREVKSEYHKYPYFSDEWNAVALVKYTIDKGSLPNVNPLYKNSPFPNPMFPYFSFLSEIFLLNQLDSVMSFIFVSIFFASLICILIFVLLKRYGVSDISNTLVVLSLPYITVGANLPGLWHLLPMTLGIIFLLLVLLSIKEKNAIAIALSTILSLIFYPPMIVFVLSLLLGYKFEGKVKINKKFWYFSLGIAIIAIFSFIFISLNMKGGIMQKISTLIFRDNLEPGIPLFKVENVLPIWILLLSIVGLYFVIQKKMYSIAYPTIVGLVFWIFYTQTQKVFLIDYPRVVVITAILLSIISAFGFDLLLNKYKQIKYEKWAVYILIIIFAISSFFYTQREKWQKLYMIVKVADKYIRVNPAPPANQYLHKDDLKIFSRFTEKIFLAPAWKGLSIGASTGNFPLESKSATITNRIYSYDTFLKANCKDKIEAIEKYKINYIYSKEFTCSGFKKEAESSEGLVLYSTFVK